MPLNKPNQTKPNQTKKMNITKDWDDKPAAKKDLDMAKEEGKGNGKI